MNNVLKYVAIAIILAGCVTSYFCKIDWVDVVALGSAFAAAGYLVSQLLEKTDKEKKNFLFYLSLVLICVGAFLAGLAGATSDSVVKIISAVGSLIALIIGIFFQIKLSIDKKE